MKFKKRLKRAWETPEGKALIIGGSIGAALLVWGAFKLTSSLLFPSAQQPPLGPGAPPAPAIDARQQDAAMSALNALVAGIPGVEVRLAHADQAHESDATLRVISDFAFNVTKVKAELDGAPAGTHSLTQSLHWALANLKDLQISDHRADSLAAGTTSLFLAYPNSLLADPGISGTLNAISALVWETIEERRHAAQQQQNQ